MNKYGMELILDLHGCDPDTFNRDSLTKFFAALCKEIGMVPEDLHFWDYEDVPDDERTEHSKQPHMDGISAVQFIQTSNITIHTLFQLKAVYLNIFSCKDFDPVAAKFFASGWFKAKEISARSFDRM